MEDFISSLKYSIENEKKIAELLKPEVSCLLEELSIQREKVNKLNDELKNYNYIIKDQKSNIDNSSILNATSINSERQVLLHSFIQGNSDNSENSINDKSNLEMTVDNSTDEDNILVTNILKKCTKEYAEKALEIDKFVSLYKDTKDFEQLTNTKCKSVMISFIKENDISLKLEIKYQFLKFTKKTDFETIIKYCLDLWNLSDDQGKINDFCLKLLSNDNDIDSIDINPKEFVDEFLKINSNIKQARFILWDKSKLIKDSIIKKEMNKENDTKILIKNEKKIEGLTLKFLNKFMGVSTYARNKIEYIINYRDNSNKLKIDSSSYLTFAINVFIWIINFLFLIFTYLTLFEMQKTTSSFFARNQLNNMLLYNNNSIFKFDDSNSIQYDILDRLKIIFLDDLARQNSLLNSIKILGKLRISFYRTISNNCSNYRYLNFITKRNCYESEYKSSTANTSAPLMKGSGLNIDNTTNFTITSPNNINISYVLLDNSTNPSNSRFINNASIIQKFVSLIMINMTSNNISNLDYSISGQLGKYTGTNCFNIFVNPYEMSNLVFAQIINNVYNTSITDESLRSVITSFSYYDFPTHMFIYVYIVYEISNTGFILTPLISIKSFHYNIYNTTNGPFIRYLDILRFVLGILILVFTPHQLMNIKPGNDRVFLFTNIILLNLFICFFFFVSYGLRMTNLNNPFNSEVILDLTYEIKEFYRYKNSYYINTVLECLLAFSMMIKICFDIGRFHKIKLVILYIRNSFKKIFYYIIFIVALIGSFTVFSNNLWGLSLQKFSDLNSCLFNVLFFSIGSMDVDEILETNEIGVIWNIIFFYLFFSIIILFYLNTFAGIFVEVYRKTTLIKGNPKQIEKIYNMK